MVGRCVGWPNPHIEIKWSSFPPPGQGAKNANSIKRGPPGGLHTWFYAGGWPGVWATRINGMTANPWGAGGYPNINYAVYDLRDDNVQVGQSYEYIAKYRADLPSLNMYSTAITAASCGGAPPTPTPAPTPSVQPGSVGLVSLG
jgi:hypothetical protein